MAMTPEQKKAYNKEYYEKYRKKGTKKGRKKGSTTTTSKTSSLLGINISGFNDEGRIQAALIKDKLKSQMNTALKSAKSDEEREKIRLEYSRKAAQQIAALRAKPEYAKAKATSTKSSSGSSKSNKTTSSGTTRNTSSGSSTKTKATTTTQATYDNSAELTEDAVSKLTMQAESLMAMAKKLSPTQKAAVKKTVQSIIDKLKLLGGVSDG